MLEDVIVTEKQDTPPDADGVYADVPDLVYHRDQTSLSSSGARLLLPPSVPAKFRYLTDNPPDPKPAYDFGHVAHRLVLGRGAEFSVLHPDIHGLKNDGTPSDKPTATAAWKQAVAEARERDQVPIHTDVYNHAEQMAKVVLTDPVAGPLFTNGIAEVSLYASDAGVRLRARPDWVTTFGGERLILVDYKTADDANPITFGRVAHKYGYYIQMPWYITVSKLLGLHDYPGFVFVVQEKKPPYLVSVCELDAEAYQLGWEKMREAINLFAWCRHTDSWPGYAQTIHQISLPPWAFAQSTVADMFGEVNDDE